ncbi:hypothetical protein COCCADRAFT_84718, partial [Bipolaris zeicola 26-R-13]
CPDGGNLAQGLPTSGLRFVDGCGCRDELFFSLAQSVACHGCHVQLRLPAAIVIQTLGRARTVKVIGQFSIGERSFGRLSISESAALRDALLSTVDVWMSAEDIQ